jgi:hypothetical protein
VCLVHHSAYLSWQPNESGKLDKNRPRRRVDYVTIALDPYTPVVRYNRIFQPTYWDAEFLSLSSAACRKATVPDNTKTYTHTRDDDAGKRPKSDYDYDEDESDDEG